MKLKYIRVIIMDYCKYVNIFQGCGEIDLPEPKGIAAKWFFLKAQCGNTSPAALIPFGGMSVAPFTGAYPTGYGNHKVNTHARPEKDENCSKLLGFAHLQQSGTGYIGYYYNYALTVPKYSDSPVRREFTDEFAEPGYYACTTDDIRCELTSTSNTAFHRYSFGSDNGFITIDFSNNGLHVKDEKEKKAEILDICCDGSKLTAVIYAEGIKLYFAAECNGQFRKDGNLVIFDGFGKTAGMKISASTRSAENALRFLNEGKSFDSVRSDAYGKWNEYLSRFRIEADDEIKEIFYSNLYHSLVKPCIRNNDSFIYGDGEFAVDFATLWDMYKTALPMICMAYKNEAEIFCETLLKLCEKLGEIPNNFGICDRYLEHSTQARTLGAYVLMTAYHYGIDIDAHRMLKAIESDIFAPNKTDFTVEGKCKSHTWMLDMADCCGNAAAIAEKIGENEIADRLRPLSKQWEKCFDKETGLLGTDSDYYEGTLWNYSFRQMLDMDKRIDIAGGKERFIELLDKFFGYGEPDVIQAIDPHNPEIMKAGEKLGRFEGFNNESDTESPYSYIYADRHDRTCEIIRAGMKYMFTKGRGGLPGNNDTDALSSYYVMAALGIFPVAGQNLFLLGSPVISGGEIMLSSGNVLKIIVNNNSDENIYVQKVSFNGKEITDFRISADLLLSGGTLYFEMGGKNNV